MTTFGANLKAIRERAGLSQEDLAARIGLKGQAPISNWERGAKLPHPETIVTLAEALGCTTVELLAGVETPYDRLRGAYTVTPEPVDDLRLDAEERAEIRARRRLSPAQRRLLRAMVEAVAKYRPDVNDNPPQSREPTPRRVAGPQEATRGRRPSKSKR